MPQFFQHQENRTVSLQDLIDDATYRPMLSESIAPLLEQDCLRQEDLDEFLDLARKRLLTERWRRTG